MHGGSKTDGLCDSNPPLPHKTNSYTLLGGESNRLRGGEIRKPRSGERAGGWGLWEFLAQDNIRLPSPVLNRSSACQSCDSVVIPLILDTAMSKRTAMFVRGTYYTARIQINITWTTNLIQNVLQAGLRPGFRHRLSLV
jgi:hypothetical protein